MSEKEFQRVKVIENAAGGGLGASWQSWARYALGYLRAWPLLKR